MHKVCRQNMLGWLNAWHVDKDAEIKATRLKHMLQPTYGPCLNLQMLLQDMWKAEVCLVSSRVHQKSTAEFFDCCGPYGNLHFLMLWVYPFLGYTPIDWIIWYDKIKHTSFF